MYDSLRRDVFAIFRRLEAIDRKLNILLEMRTDIMAEIDRLKAEVAENTSVVQSAITLIQSISQMLKDAIASGDPAELSRLADQLDANEKSLAEAVAANTPAPTPEEPEPNP